MVAVYDDGQADEVTRRGIARLCHIWFNTCNGCDFLDPARRQQFLAFASRTVLGHLFNVSAPSPNSFMMTLRQTSTSKQVLVQPARSVNFQTLSAPPVDDLDGHTPGSSPANFKVFRDSIEKILAYSAVEVSSAARACVGSLAL